MRSNYKLISPSRADKAAHKVAHEEAMKVYDEAFQNVVNDVIPQCMAAVVYSLAITFSFGKKRIKRFMDSFNATNEMMMTKGVIFGKDFTPDDMIKYIENKYGIDLTIRELDIRKRK